MAYTLKSLNRIDVGEAIKGIMEKRNVLHPIIKYWDNVSWLLLSTNQVLSKSNQMLVSLPSFLRIFMGNIVLYQMFPKLDFIISFQILPKKKASYQTLSFIYANQNQHESQNRGCFDETFLFRRLFFIENAGLFISQDSCHHLPLKDNN